MPTEAVGHNGRGECWRSEFPKGWDILLNIEITFFIFNMTYILHLAYSTGIKRYRTYNLSVNFFCHTWFHLKCNSCVLIGHDISIVVKQRRNYWRFRFTSILDWAKLFNFHSHKIFVCCKTNDGFIIQYVLYYMFYDFFLWYFPPYVSIQVLSKSILCKDIKFRTALLS